MLYLACYWARDELKYTDACVQIHALQDSREHVDLWKKSCLYSYCKVNIWFPCIVFNLLSQRGTRDTLWSLKKSLCLHWQVCQPVDDSCSGIDVTMWNEGRPRLSQSTLQNVSPAAHSYLCFWHQTCKWMFFTHSYISYKLRSPCH